MRGRLVRVMCLAILVCGLSMPALAANSEVPDLDGYHWQHSERGEKLAFLYGASSVVAIDQLIATKQGTEPSLFVVAWMEAFGNSSLRQVQEKIDAWYGAHPEESNRGVFDVLWYEFMAPTIEKDAKKAGES